MINDFIEYWTAARIFLSGGNPYSPVELLQHEQAIGWTQPVALIMWNPPWTLSFILPFGLVDYATAQFAWFVLHVLIIFVGAQVLWQVYGGDGQKSRYAWISVLTFGPTVFVLLLGQIGPLILLGLVGFLFFLRRRTWGLAGVSMAFISIKPHLLYLLWLALVVWSLKERQWKVIAGLIISGTFIASLPLVFDTAIYTRYLELIRTAEVIRPLEWATPTLGTALAELFAIHGMWIRWLPSFAGGLWFLWYWSRRAGAWDWIAELPLMLLVSVTTASFAWSFDHIVLLPAVIQCAVWTARNENREKRKVIVSVHVLLGLLLLTVRVFVRNDFWYFWVAPGYLFFYLYVRSSVGADSREQRPGKMTAAW
jgi:hypothetical protein